VTRSASSPDVAANRTGEAAPGDPQQRDNQHRSADAAVRCRAATPASWALARSLRAPAQHECPGDDRYCRDDEQILHGVTPGASIPRNGAGAGKFPDRLGAGAPSEPSDHSEQQDCGQHQRVVEQHRIIPQPDSASVNAAMGGRFRTGSGQRPARELQANHGGERRPITGISAASVALRRPVLGESSSGCREVRRRAPGHSRSAQKPGSPQTWASSPGAGALEGRSCRSPHPPRFSPMGQLGAREASAASANLVTLLWSAWDPAQGGIKSLQKPGLRPVDASAHSFAKLKGKQGRDQPQAAEPVRFD
jgi:hypothetical protein